MQEKKVITSVPIEYKELILDLKFDSSNGYAILIDNDLAGIIEVVDNMTFVDLEAIRTKYIPE